MRSTTGTAGLRTRNPPSARPWRRIAPKSRRYDEVAPRSAEHDVAATDSDVFVAGRLLVEDGDAALARTRASLGAVQIAKARAAARRFMAVDGRHLNSRNAHQALVAKVEGAAGFSEVTGEIDPLSKAAVAALIGTGQTGLRVEDTVLHEGIAVGRADCQHAVVGDPT